VVKAKYFSEIYDPFLLTKNENLGFRVIEEPRNQERRLTNVRNGQSVFKGIVLKAYNNACCVTGETIPELLEAAHIQEYRNFNSNHVQNGLLLRVDIHRLYDNNLIFIDNNFIVRVSSLVENAYYKNFNGKPIMLPKDEHEHPAAEALEFRRSEFRN